MPKNCISIYNEFSNIGPTRRTWAWRIKVKFTIHNGMVDTSQGMDFTCNYYSVCVCVCMCVCVCELSAAKVKCSYYTSKVVQLFIHLGVATCADQAICASKHLGAVWKNFCWLALTEKEDKC